MQAMTLNIQGMSCGHCIAAVHQALGQLEGVQIQEVEVGHATIAYDPMVASPEQISAAIASAGYSA